MKKFVKDFLGNSETRKESGEVAALLPETYEQLTNAIRKEADQVIAETKLEVITGEPQAFLREARERVSSVRANLPEITNLNGFRNGDFKYELDKLKSDVSTLEREYERLQNQ